VILVRRTFVAWFCWWLTVYGLRQYINLSELDLHPTSEMFDAFRFGFVKRFDSEIRDGGGFNFINEDAHI